MGILPPLESLLPPSAANRTAKSGGKSKGNDNFLTPPEFVEVLCGVERIALDPCGSFVGSFVGARREYLIERGEDGLVLPWADPDEGLNFYNPPYSKTRKWIEKANRESKERHATIVALVAARTDTIAFQNTCAKAVCFWKGRLTFLDPITKEPPKDKHGKPCGAMFPSMVLYWGGLPNTFVEVFKSYGRCTLLF